MQRRARWQPPAGVLRSARVVAAPHASSPLIDIALRPLFGRGRFATTARVSSFVPILAPSATAPAAATTRACIKQDPTLSSHYNSNQPRVPAGHHDGGQWTGGGSHELAILNSPLFDRDRLIKAALGVRDDDEKSRGARPALLAPPPTLVRRPPPAFLPRLPFRPGFLVPLRPVPYIGAAIALYSLLSQFNDDDQQAVIAFRSREYRRSPSDGAFDLQGVDVLSPEEVREICGDQFYKVRDIVDRAYDDTKRDNKQLSPAQLGTKVHKRIEDEIEALDHPEVTAEVTYEQETPNDPTKPERRGAKHSIRVDVRNEVNDETVCIEEIKTGEKGLSFQRMQEIVRRQSDRDQEKKIKRIIVTEMRPKNAPFPKPKPTLQNE